MSLDKYKARLTYREWDRMRNALQDSADFSVRNERDKALLDKLDWHCADTFDIPMDDGRQWPQAENE